MRIHISRIRSLGAILMVMARASSPFATRAKARRVIFEYLDSWYNRQRLHSSLGYVSPAAFEQQYADEIKTVR